jgi:phenylacetate-CoA ligase
VVSRERCDCGRTALRLDRLRGRVDDMVIFKGVNFYPRQVEAILLRQPGFGHEYQIVLDADGGGGRMTILVERAPGHEAVSSARASRELRDLLSLSPEIRLCAAGELERPQGKAVRVVDRRTNQHGGPSHGPPKPPDARDAPAKPWRPSKYSGSS